MKVRISKSIAICQWQSKMHWRRTRGNDSRIGPYYSLSRPENSMLYYIS